MITVVMDTNILLQETLTSRKLQVLGRLAKAYKIKICIPNLVKREFITNRIFESLANLKSANDKVTEVFKAVNNQRIVVHLTQTQERLKKASSLIEDAVHEDFESWVKSNHVKILNFDPANLDGIFDDYFAGTGVYRKPKYREDIPDAFIGSCVKKLKEEVGELDVICKDGAFRKYLDNVPDCSVHTDLQSYLASERIVEVLKELDAESATIEYIKEYLATPDFLEILTECLASDERMARGIYLIDEITGDQNVVIDHFGLSINGADSKSINQLHFGEVSYIDSGAYSIQCSFIADSTLGYCAEYMDYMRLDEALKSEIDLYSMNGDGICDLVEKRQVAFDGYVEINIPEGMPANEVKAHAQYINTPKRQILITLDIDQGDILPR